MTTHHYYPYEVGHYHIGGFGNTVTLKDNYAIYALSLGIKMIDITDPEFFFEDRTLAGVNAKDVAISEDLMVVAEGGNGLRVFDYSMFHDPVQLAIYRGHRNAQRLELNNSIVYLANAADGFEVVNLSTPSNPISMYNYSTGMTVEELLYRNEICYLAHKNDGISVMNVTDLQDIQLIAHAAGSVYDIASQDEMIFTVGHSELTVYNVSVPSEISAINNHSTGFCRTIDIYNDIAAVGMHNGSLLLFNISDPVNLEKIGQNDDLGFKINDIEIKNDYIYISHYMDGLFIYNLGIDSDFDGLSDYIENEVSLTEDDNPDSDGDGLNDGDEFNLYNTDPNDESSDFDLLSDGDEILIYGTDPLSYDTDGDSFRDDEEVQAGTDPNNACETPDDLWVPLVRYAIIFSGIGVALIIIFWKYKVKFIRRK